MIRTINVLVGISIPTFQTDSTAKEEPLHLRNNQFLAYPNPVNDHLSIQFPRDTNRIELLDISGRQIQLIQCSNLTSASLSTSDLIKGIYLLRFTSDSGKIQSQKIIKR